MRKENLYTVSLSYKQRFAEMIAVFCCILEGLRNQLLPFVVYAFIRAYCIYIVFCISVHF